MPSTATLTEQFHVQHNAEISGTQSESIEVERGSMPRPHLASERLNSVAASNTIPMPSIPTAVIQDQVPTAVTAAADESVAAALKDIKMAIQATRVLQHQSTRIPHPGVSPTSTMGQSTNNRRHPNVGSVIMNGSTVPTNNVPNSNDGSNGIISSNNVANGSQISKIVSQSATNAPPSEQNALDPWVPRNNAVPTLPPIAPLGANNDIQGSASTNRVVVAGAIDRSTQSISAAAPSACTTNTSQAVQTITQNSLQKGKPSVPVANSNTLPSTTAAQNVSASLSQKESGKHHNVLMADNAVGEKGAGRRDVVHSQDVNIDDDVEDLEEDEDEEDDDDEELEDEESESELGEERVPTPKNMKEAADDDLDTDQETDRLLGQQYNDDNGYYDSKVGLHYTFS